MRTRWLLPLSLFLVITPACAGSDGAPAGPRRHDAGRGGTADAGSGGGGATTDLPCEVANLLTTYCTPCHGSPPAAGAPMSLRTHADLTAVSVIVPGETQAERSLARMRDAMRPMPPAGPAPDAAALAAFEAWITAGSPSGSCTVDDPFAGPPRSTSGTTWTGGNRESPLMRPGGACVACHVSMREGPVFSIAGAVFPSGHEPDDCNGAVPYDVTVEITDASGEVLRLTPNAAGNFFWEDRIALPYRARVLASGRERVMTAPQTSGDCNACHTQMGLEGAPGRIVAP